MELRDELVIKAREKGIDYVYEYIHEIGYSQEFEKKTIRYISNRINIK